MMQALTVRWYLVRYDRRGVTDWRRDNVW